MTTLPESKPRLSPHEEPTLFPFVRAEAARDCSIYWCGTRSFPMNLYDRTWLLEFLRRFALQQKQTARLREETFLQAKATLPDLMDLFLKRSQTYVPIAGMTLIPGTAPIPLPRFEDLRQAAKDAGESGKGVDVNRWMPDHAHWFVAKEAEAQRQDFFGHGGLFSLLLKADSNAAPPLPRVPRILSSHPAWSSTLDKQFAAASSLKDDFLAKSKQIFGEPFKDDASYPGLMFVLPLLTASSLLAATPDQRKAWFELFDAYWIESKPDKGLLLVCKDPDFDPSLIEILESMRADGFSYRGTL